MPIVQYERRTNYKIINVEEKEDEKTNEIAISVCKTIGVEIAETDISTSHRLPTYTPKESSTDNGGTEAKKTSTIIVKMARRDPRDAVLDNRKKLHTL